MILWLIDGLIKSPLIAVSTINISAKVPEYMLCLQNGRFDHPDRMFNSIPQEGVRPRLEMKCENSFFLCFKGKTIKMWNIFQIILLISKIFAFAKKSHVLAKIILNFGPVNWNCSGPFYFLWINFCTVLTKKEVIPAHLSWQYWKGLTQFYSFSTSRNRLRKECRDVFYGNPFPQRNINIEM